jgi:toxin ParE1/3/4
MLRLKLSDKAKADLDNIFLHGLMTYGDAAAERYLDELSSQFEIIAESPGIVRERTEIRPPVRLYPFRAHHVLYMTLGDEVVILQVLHRSANWIDHL